MQVRLSVAIWIPIHHHQKYNEFTNLRPSDSGVAMGEVMWPHQLARSKGGKLDLKCTFYGSNLLQCVHRFPRWRPANRQSILLIRRDWSHCPRCLPDGDKNGGLSLSWFLQLLSPIFYTLPLFLSFLLSVSVPLHVSNLNSWHDSGSNLKQT